MQENVCEGNENGGNSKNKKLDSIMREWLIRRHLE